MLFSLGFGEDDVGSGFGEDNVGSGFGEDNVVSGFGEDDVGSGFGEDDVGSGFGEDDVDSGFGEAMNNLTKENDIPKNIIMTMGAAIMKSVAGLIIVFPEVICECLMVGIYGGDTIKVLLFSSFNTSCAV